MTQAYRRIVLIAGAYPDVQTARHAFNAVQDSYVEADAVDDFDAVVVGRQDSGRVKIFKKPLVSTHPTPLVGHGWGLAAGLVVALYPAAAQATGLLVGAPEASAGLDAMAGRISAQMSRLSLKAMGGLLDGAPAVVVAAAATENAGEVRRILEHAHPIHSVDIELDKCALEKDIREAQREIRSKSRPIPPDGPAPSGRQAL